MKYRISPEMQARVDAGEAFIDPETGYRKDPYPLSITLCRIAEDVYMADEDALDYMQKNTPFLDMNIVKEVRMPLDIVSMLVKSGKKKSLAWALDHGARPMTPLGPLFHIFEREDEAFMERDAESLLEILLSKGVGHVAGFSHNGITARMQDRSKLYLTRNDRELVPFSEPDESEFKVVCVNRPYIQKIGVADVLQRVKDGGDVVKEMLLAHANSKQKNEPFGLTHRDLEALYTTLWHEDEEVQQALFAYPAEVEAAMEGLPPIIRSAYEGLRREHTVGYINAVIEGPVKDWSALQHGAPERIRST